MGIHRSKKILAALLALILVLAVCPAPVSATEATCPCCGEKMADIDWQPLPAQKSLPSGHYRATADGVLPRAYTSSGTATLDLNGYDLTTIENERAFFVYSNTFTVLDSVGTGSISNVGTLADNGGVFRVRKGAVLNIYGGTFNGGTLAAEMKGGCIRIEGTANMYGGTVTGGRTSHHGGNVNVSGGEFNLYGGTIFGGETSDVGRGGNIYLTEKAKLNMYGGTVTGGHSAGAGGNIFAYKGATVNIYGGTVEGGIGDQGGHDIYVIGSTDGVYSTLNIFGGTVGSNEESLLQYSENNRINIYNGTIGLDPTPYLVDCACVNADETEYKVWNVGRRDNSCGEDCPFTQAAERVEEIFSGNHTYAHTDVRNTYGCSVCSHTYYDENAVAVTQNGIFSTLSGAVAAGGDIWLLDDVTEETLVLNGVILDLNGYQLTADSFTATAGKLIDSTGGNGGLFCDSTALAQENQYLPLAADKGLQFSTMTPDVTLERLTEETVRVRFLFTEKAADTVIDELVLAGNTDISVELHLTWKKDGKKKEKIYVCDPELLVKYAQKWDGRRYVVTISGVDAVEDLTCTVKLVSKASSNVTVSATKLNNVAYINNKLSWEDINSYPIKKSDMTVEEMRQLCVDFFEYSKSFLWTPDESVEYLRNKNDSNDSMKQGTIYGGMPYVGNASGSPYRMMDYIDPETGLVDMRKALPSMANGGTLDMVDLIYFGSQCAKTAGLGWGRVINSANYRATYVMTPSNGVILLGDVQMDESKNWSENYRTTTVCQNNGTEVMYAAYAQVQKADGFVQYTSAGHVIMAYADAVVVYNEDGSINGDESYVNIIHQAQSWTNQENEAGDQYKMKSSVNTPKTFAELYSGGYVPFTFAEFVSGDPVEQTTLAVTDEDTTLISGVIREEDQVFAADTTVADMTFSQLCGLTLTSNYSISDAYIIVYNNRGQVLYKHAVRSTTAYQTMEMVAEGDRVTTWEYGKVDSGKAYRAELVVQLTTGERPTVWSGQLRIDN